MKKTTSTPPPPHSKEFQQGMKEFRKKRAITLAGKNWGEDRETHNLLVIKKAPPEVDRLRRLLARPEHRDIFRVAATGRTFEDCIGHIAAMLDIVLDGEYDVPDLCGMLCRALDARGTLGNSPEKLDSRLVPVELHEREDSIEIMEQKLKTIAPTPLVDRMRFMQEQNCTQCDNIAACMLRKKCLGDDAINVVITPEGKLS